MSRLISLALLLLSLSAHAFDRGNVLLENRTRDSFEMWQYVGGPYAYGYGVPLIYTVPRFSGAGHFIMPSPNLMVFEHDRTVAWWDGRYRTIAEPGPGYTDIFTSDSEPGEIIPMRNGHFLVAEQERLTEFDLHARINAYAVTGVQHMTLLSDQCTLLYTRGDNAVHRFNLCTQQSETDFATLTSGEAGALRQLATGDVIVANGSAILQFNAAGSLVRTYEFNGVTNVALTPDGQSFWAAAVHDDKAELRRFELDGNSQAVALGNPEMHTIVVPVAVSDLVVVGEWSPASVARGRVARH